MQTIPFRMGKPHGPAAQRGELDTVPGLDREGRAF